MKECTTRVGSYSCTPLVHTINTGTGVSFSLIVWYWYYYQYQWVLGGLPRAYTDTCTVLYGRYSSYSLYQVLSAWGGFDICIGIPILGADAGAESSCDGQLRSYIYVVHSYRRIKSDAPLSIRI